MEENLSALPWLSIDIDVVSQLTLHLAWYHHEKPSKKVMANLTAEKVIECLNLPNSGWRE